jgi:uncharacterized RmlC-like cupin family protein
MNWRDGVRIVRGKVQEAAMLAPSAAGRATAFEFTGGGGIQTWIGTVTLQPNTRTGPHHHGRHEVGVHVLRGQGEVRWGERLEFASEIRRGDFVYFASGVPHQEINSSATERLDFLVVRSDGEGITINLDTIVPTEAPEKVS